MVENRISEADRGIEIKDRSDPLMVHNTIERSTAGMVLQIKNWRYAGGGRGTLVLSRLTGNGTDLVLDRASRLLARHSQIGSDPIDPAPIPRWMTAAAGVPRSDRRAGATGRIPASLVPLEPVYRMRFDRPFYEDAPGWTVEGQARLRIRDGELRARLERGRARWSSPVRWDLDAGLEYELALEFALRNVRDARITLSSEAGEVRFELPGGSDTGPVELATFAIPPGRYTTIGFEGRVDPSPEPLDPTTGLLEPPEGQFDVLRIRLFQPGGDDR